MSCIGTAGHVDHGKSALVTALTGMDPDRLAEEKARGMTIDLGFAWLRLPGGQEVSIVDVPGHEDFIKNMLAGVGGIDAALLVIAADEGVMPQTREHVAILDLLRVQQGVVALTKADLVDAEWLDLVRAEVKTFLQDTTLAASPIIPVSAHTRQGLPDVLYALESILETVLIRKNIARPRLPIDRVFSMTGFGTVVTGTLLDGSFRVGQDVEILPQGLKTRIRGLQTHKQQRELALPGNRVAINLPNIARTDLARGNVVVLPGQVHTTLLVDARVELLSTAPRPLLHNALVDLYANSQEIPARVRLLDVDELTPGNSAWVQLRLSHPAVLTRHDRFILRLPSPSTTIGGGEIVDPLPRYHRRRQPAILEALERLLHGTTDELVMAALDRRNPQTKGIHKAASGLTGWLFTDVVKGANLAPDVTQQTLESLESTGRARKVGAFWFAQHLWDALLDASSRLLQEYHDQYPLRSGLSKEEWRTRLGLPPRLAADVFPILQAEGYLEVLATQNGQRVLAVESQHRGGSLVCLPGFAPRFTRDQQRQVEQLLQQFHAQPYIPPLRAEAEALVGAEVVNALLEQGQLVHIGEGIIFLSSTYAEAVAALVQYMREHDSMTVAQARDLLGTSRKYIVPLLENLDTSKITRRAGDQRVLHTP